MFRLKKLLIWIALVLLFAIGGSALWFKMKVDEEWVEELPEPDIPTLEMDLPDPDNEE